MGRVLGLGREGGGAGESLSSPDTTAKATAGAGLSCSLLQTQMTPSEAGHVSICLMEAGDGKLIGSSHGKDAH